MPFKIEPTAKRIPTIELLRNFGAHSDEAMAGPIIVTKHGRDRFVLITVEHYRQRVQPERKTA